MLLSTAFPEGSQRERLLHCMLSSTWGHPRTTGGILLLTLCGASNKNPSFWDMVCLVWGWDYLSLMHFVLLLPTQVLSLCSGFPSVNPSFNHQPKALYLTRGKLQGLRYEPGICVSVSCLSAIFLHNHSSSWHSDIWYMQLGIHSPKKIF